MQAEGDDFVSGIEVGDAGAEVADGSGDVAAEDGGEFDGEALFGGAAAHFVVDGVDAGGGDADEDFAFGGDGVGDVFVLQIFGGAVFVEDDCFHGWGTSWRLDAGQTASTRFEPEVSIVFLYGSVTISSLFLTNVGYMPAVGRKSKATIYGEIVLE